MSGYSCPPRISYGDFSNKIHDLSLKHRLPIDGMIELTQRCNLKCSHCYCARDKCRKELTSEQIFRIIDQIAEAGCFWLAFTGGEIFLRADFLDIYHYAKSKGLLVSLMTNGTLLDEEKGRYLGKYKPFQVEITLYGITEETNARVTNVKGMLKKSLAAIDVLLKNKVPLKLKTTVTKDNVHELWRIKRYAESRKLDFRFDAQVHARIDGARTPWKYRLNPEEVVNLDLKDQDRLKGWKEYCSRFSGSLHFDSYFYCSALINSFHIDPRGRLLACVLCRSLYEDLLKKDFQDCWEGLYKRLIARKPARGFKCQGCSLGRVCDSCPGWAEVENGSWAKESKHLCRIAHLRQGSFSRIGVIKKEEGGNV